MQIAARWEAGFSSGQYRAPEIRRPVLIRPDGPVSSREQLQELVGGPDLPDISTTTMYEPAGFHRPGPKDGAIPEEVQICDVNLEQVEKLEELAEVTDFEDCVLFKGDERFVIKVLSIKGQGKLGEADKEQEPQASSRGAEVLSSAESKSAAEGGIDV